MLQLLGSHNFIPNWCTSRLPCGNFIPKFGLPSVFPLGFPDFVFPTNGSDAVPGLTNESVRWSHHLHQQGPPSNEACFPSSVSWSSSKRTYSMVLLASRAAARACQCWRLRPQKPTQAERYPQAISYDHSLGCWRLVRTPTFMPIYFGLRTHHSNKIHWISMLSMVLQTPPRRPPGLDSLFANRVAVEPKLSEGFVDAQSIGQGLEEMASRASSEWPVARHNPKIPLKAFRQYYQSGQSDKAAHAFCKHCEKKTL